MRTADHPAFLPNSMSPEDGGRLYLTFFSPAPQAMLSREEVLSISHEKFFKERIFILCYIESFLDASWSLCTCPKWRAMTFSELSHVCVLALTMSTMTIYFVLSSAFFFYSIRHTQVLSKYLPDEINKFLQNRLLNGVINIMLLFWSSDSICVAE